MKLSFAFFKQHSTISIASGVGVLLIAVLAARGLHKPPASDNSQSSKPVSQLMSVRDFAQAGSLVSANGTVESLEQADLRSQATGKVTRINVVVGQHVVKGQVLAALEQQSQAAALTSARGALAQAQANYNRVLSGASNEDINLAQVAVDTAQAALTNTQKQQQVAVGNAYEALLNSGLTAVAGGGNLDAVTATVSGAYDAQETGEYKITLYSAGDGMHFQTSGLESVSGLVKTTPQTIGKRGLFIQFSSTSASTNDTWTITIPNTQSASYVANNNAYQAALETQKSAVEAAQNAVLSAQAALDLKKATARPADVQAAEAQVLIAQGQVQAAQAALDNTIISAPFNGIISAVPVKFADLVTAGSNVVSIVSQGGLQVKIFVSDIDLGSIHVGDSAGIGKNSATGTVANVAPNVSAVSKTAEVDVSIDDPAKSGLTIGQNVEVTVKGKTTGSALENSFLLPLQAVKITPDGHNYVYTLDQNSKAQEIEVSVGKVDGEHVLVINGLTSDMKILSNAYGVSAGDEVEIQK